MADLTLAKAFVEIGYKGFDKVNAWMNYLSQEVQKGIGPVNNVFQQIKNGMLDLGRSASPLAFNTFTGSIELLKARIGQSFTPYIVAASRSIQDLSMWIRNLDPETKKSIASWIAWGAAISGVVVVGGKLTLMLLEIGKVLGTIGLQFYKLAVANPFLTALIAIGTAAVYTANKLGELQKKTEDIQKTYERAKSGKLNEGDVEQSYILRKLMEEKDPEKRKKKAAGHVQILQGRYDEIVKQTEDAKGLGEFVSHMTGGPSLANTLADQMKEVKRDLEIAKQFAEGKTPKILPGGAKKKEKDEFAMGGYGANAGIGIGSLESAYNKLQMTAIGRDDVQKKILEAQMESNKLALQQSKVQQGFFEMVLMGVGQ